jgi:hypothetical protein
MNMFRRLLIGCVLAVTGAWLLAAVRLTMIRDYFSLIDHETISFVLDLVSLTTSFFGLLTIISVIPGLHSRLKRLESLGEHDW